MNNILAFIIALCISIAIGFAMDKLATSLTPKDNNDGNAQIKQKNH